MKKTLLTLILLFSAGVSFAENQDDDRLYYFLEVGNQIALSDFQMGSTEKIKDKDGNGVGLAFVIKEGSVLKLALDFGYSETVYKGAVEDGVDVSFTPQTGTGFETLSSSTNVKYDFDVGFTNPYLGLNLMIENFMIGGGRIFQKAKGGVVLSSQDVEIATASYQTSTQLYYQAGFHFALDSLYFGFLARGFEAPSLVIDSCNTAALGDLVCTRIKSATGNRNLRSTQFGEGVLRLGFLF